MTILKNELIELILIIANRIIGYAIPHLHYHIAGSISKKSFNSQFRHKKLMNDEDDESCM